MNAEDGVLGQTELEQQAAAMTVFGNVRDADLPSPPRIDRAQVASTECDGSGDLRFWKQSGQRLDEFRLTVALDTGDADNLARSDVEGDPVDALHRKIPNREYRRTRFRR